MAPAKNESPAIDWGTQRAGGLAWRVNYEAKKSHKSTFLDNEAIVSFHMDECSWDT